MQVMSKMKKLQELVCLKNVSLNMNEERFRVIRALLGQLRESEQWSGCKSPASCCKSVVCEVVVSFKSYSFLSVFGSLF